MPTVPRRRSLFLTFWLNDRRRFGELLALGSLWIPTEGPSLVSATFGLSAPSASGSGGVDGGGGANDTALPSPLGHRMSSSDSSSDSLSTGPPVGRWRSGAMYIHPTALRLREFEPEAGSFRLGRNMAAIRRRRLALELVPLASSSLSSSKGRRLSLRALREFSVG